MLDGGRIIRYIAAVSRVDFGEIGKGVGNPDVMTPLPRNGMDTTSTKVSLCYCVTKNLSE
jgi:hypothetical protein